MSSMLLLALILSIFAVIQAHDFASAAKLPLSAQKPLTGMALNTTSNGWVMYKQCDSSWGSQELGTCGGDTICSSGCAMSSVAMILATKGSGKNPSALNSWLKSNGGYSSGCLINWGAVDKLGFTKYQGKETPSESEICSGLSAGHGMVANVHNGAHWVLLTGCAGNDVFYVNDPAYSTTSYKHSDIVGLAVYH